jgi:acylphosphatase
MLRIALRARAQPTERDGRQSGGGDQAQLRARDTSAQVTGGRNELHSAITLPVMPTERGPGPQDRTAAGTTRARLTATVRGRVQGVGFRAWTRRRALGLGLVGSATNLPGGEVEVVAEGERSALDELVAALQGPTAPGYVTGVTVVWEPSRGMSQSFLER